MEKVLQFFSDYKEIWLIVAGWLANELFSSTKKSLMKSYRIWKVKGTLKRVRNEDPKFVALDNAIPYYAKENIKLRLSDKKFIISIPESHREGLVSHGFEYRGNLSFTSPRFSGLFLENEIPRDFEEIVQNSALEAAKQFLSELEVGHIRFNGLMYGVYKISPKRLTTKEEAGLYIDFYTTDYFTYRTIGKIVERLHDIDAKLIKISGITDVNRLNELMPSFGLGCFAILNRGYGDEILLGKRSDKVVVDRGMWHFSMNEAFSVNDVDNYGSLSFSACLYRGIREELGLNEAFDKNIKEHEFLDIDIITDRLEPGILAFVRIRLDENLTYQTLLDCYATAQDSALETDSITTIKINDLDTFIDDNYETISVGCRCALRNLLARYKAGYLREDG